MLIDVIIHRIHPLRFSSDIFNLFFLQTLKAVLLSVRYPE